MRAVDRICAVLMFMAGALHALGSYMAYRNNRLTLLWALSASLFVFLLAAINFLRTARPADRSLALICFFGCLGWIGFVISFGVLIGNVFDFRPLVNFVIAFVLAFFSLRAALRPAS